jgi:hypothetical protein
MIAPPAAAARKTDVAGTVTDMLGRVAVLMMYRSGLGGVGELMIVLM